MPTRGPRPLRVALPMVNLVPGGMGGTETYAVELLRALRDHDDLDVTVLVPPTAAGRFAPHGERVLSLRGGSSTVDRLQSVARGLCDPRIAGAVRAVAADVVHYPFTVPVPRPRRPWVQSLHDVQHLDLPDFFPAAERAFRRMTYDAPARRAQVVVTLSEFARSRIVALLGVPPIRVVVAPLAAGSQFAPASVGREDFVLYPARRWPHKNHRRLLEAMELVRRDRPGLRLVLTGGGEPLAGAPPWVEERGFVSTDDLVGLYRTAACLVFPSLYEGFGMPPLEAMATGCPVAVSDAASLPEVVGDAGVCFDPRDVPAMARAIGAAIDGRDRLVPLGLARAAAYSWKACADVHRTAYLRAAGRA